LPIDLPPAELPRVTPDAWLVVRETGKSAAIHLGRLPAWSEPRAPTARRKALAAQPHRLWYDPVV